MNVAGTITVDIRDTIAIDQNVFDNTSTKIGIIDGFDLATGWFTVAATPLIEDRELYIPFNLITTIDPHEVFVAASKDALVRDYAQPPTRTTAVQGTGPTQAATTTQASGYDSAPLVVFRTKLDEFRNKIAVDFQVYTSDMSFLGNVRQYDATTGLMTLAKGPFSRHDVIVPISVVSAVDADLGSVTLIASKADVERMEPVDLVRTAAQIAEL